MKDLQEDDFLVELTPEEQEELKGGLVLIDIWKRPFPLGLPPISLLKDQIVTLPTPPVHPSVKI